MTGVAGAEEPDATISAQAPLPGKAAGTAIRQPVVRRRLEPESLALRNRQQQP